MKRFSILLTLLIFSAPILFGQTGLSRTERTFSNIYKGAVSSLTWLDIPVAGAYLYRNAVYDLSLRDNFLLIPPSFERDISLEYGDPNRRSPGSMDKDLLPSAVFYGRLAYAIANDLLSESGSSPSDYKNIFLFKKSLVYTFTLTEIVKNITKRVRPDGSDSRSFFSGHTSTTFAAATYLFLETDRYFGKNIDDPFLRTSLQALSFGALYGWAGYVGYSRIRDQKHYLSDVLLGAAAGSFVSYMVFNTLRDDAGIADNFNLGLFGDGIALSFKYDLF